MNSGAIRDPIRDNLSKDNESVILGDDLSSKEDDSLNWDNLNNICKKFQAQNEIFLTLKHVSVSERPHMKFRTLVV